MNNWNDLLWPLMMTSDSSNMSTLPAGLDAVCRAARDRARRADGGRGAIAILPLVVAFLLIQRHFIEGIATSGLR